MAIALAELSSNRFLTHTFVLLLVARRRYGSVALIVKADDVGPWMARHGQGSGLPRFIGCGVVLACPISD